MQLLVTIQVYVTVLLQYKVNMYSTCKHPLPVLCYF